MADIVLQENIKSVGVFSSIHLRERVLPLEIMKGNIPVPSIEMHSITDTHSCQLD